MARSSNSRSGGRHNSRRASSGEAQHRWRIAASSQIASVRETSIKRAVTASVVYGLTVLAVLSYYLARDQEENPAKVIAEHLAIAVAVIVITHLTGKWVATFSV